MTDDATGARRRTIRASPPVASVLQAAAAKAVRLRRERYTPVEAGDSSLALAGLALVVTAIVLRRQRAR